MKKFTLLVLLLCLSLQSRDVIDDTGLCKINWTEGHILCEGESAEGQSSFAAKISAKVIAQRNLLEVVKGVQIDSEITIEDGMQTSDIISSRVQGVIRGGQIISNNYNNSNKSSIATIKLKMGKDLLSALLSDPKKLSWNEKIQKYWNDFSIISEAHASAVYMQKERETIQKLLEDLRTQGNSSGVVYLENVLSSMTKNNHTGILIDISQLDSFKKAMIVRLVDENGKEIYPANLVSKNMLMKRNTSVGYMFGYEEARNDKRVFHIPLEIKPDSVYRNKKSNIVINKKQLAMINALDADVLKQAKIILVLGD
ncbi:hypothetical protein [Candidatus Sulfurimonas baltica]|uniref:Lipoprotein n=1 Tax=Candidatus Sulfurimonas baltica TaxID=2740404 RepID=A0A7S7LX49_9BACT|nr:hypothetical protein [Candidatus Sulfurimonas baltica]QOY53005.1 hypothetical protein HUE88_04795 [Candidatus Sulfurimonas baltica]